MLHKEQLDIFLTALLVLLVRLCQQLKEHALESRSALSRRSGGIFGFGQRRSLAEEIPRKW